jgi:hypothetical protein
MLAREYFGGPRCGITGNNPEGWQSETGWTGEGFEDRSSRNSERRNSEFRITLFSQDLVLHASLAVAPANRFSIRLVPCSRDHQREVA